MAGENGGKERSALLAANDRLEDYQTVFEGSENGAPLAGVVRWLCATRCEGMGHEAQNCSQVVSRRKV